MRNLLILLIIALLASCGPEVPRGTNYEMYYEYYYPYGYRFAPMRIQRFRPIKPTRRYGRVK
jgi:hypothetical protein